MREACRTILSSFPGCVCVSTYIFLLFGSRQDDLVRSKSHLLLAVGALKFLLEPAVDAACVEDVLAVELFYLDAGAEHFKAD